MFCNQCEQTAKGGCITIGVCGKKHEVAQHSRIYRRMPSEVATVLHIARIGATATLQYAIPCGQLGTHIG